MYPQLKIKQEWIQQGIVNETVDWAKSFGEFLQSNQKGTKPLTSSQIRKFFGELKRIQSDPNKFKSEIPLLKAKLAYAVGRDVQSAYQGKIAYKTKLKELQEELDKGIGFIRVESEYLRNDLNNFVKTVEAIVAFHKFFGGK